MPAKKSQSLIGTSLLIVLFTVLLFGVQSSAAEADRQEASMQTRIINPPSLYDPAPNGYSHAVVVEGKARFAFIAGQGGENADGTLSNDFSEQVAQAYRNLLSAIEAAGARRHNVTKLTTYVAEYDQSLLPIMTRHLTAVFGDHLPAQTLVPVPRLALDGMLFEVDAVVAIPQ